MNLNHENGQQLFDLLDKHLAKQITIISVLWSIIALIAIIFIVKRFTGWPYLISTTVTIFTSLFLIQLTHIPFDIINGIINQTFNLYNTFKAQSLNVKLILLISFSLWKNLTLTTAYQWSFTIITYFDKTKTYNFGIKFFLSLFTICSIITFFQLLSILIYS